MKNPGKKFEDDIKKSCPPLNFIYRLRDAGNEGKKTNKRFTITNICDFIFFDGVTLMNLELKSIKGKAFSFTNIAKTKEKQLYKLLQLLKSSDKKNTIGAYIFNFREPNKTFVVEISVLYNYIKQSEKKSININEIESIGKLVESKKLNKNYRYALENLSVNIIKSYYKGNALLELEEIE